MFGRSKKYSKIDRIADKLIATGKPVALTLLVIVALLFAVRLYVGVRIADCYTTFLAADHISQTKQDDIAEQALAACRTMYRLDYVLDYMQW